MEPSLRTELARAALRVAEYVHEGSYYGVIVSGGSNQLSRSLLALAWGVLYPDEPMPRFFVIDDEGNRLLYKRAVEDEEGSLKPDTEGFAKWMRDHLPELESFAKEPLIFVDDFAFSGEKYREVKRLLEQEFGFTNLEFAFFAAREGGEPQDEAFVGIRSDDVIRELHFFGRNIQGKENVEELLGKVRPEAERLRADALDRLRELGKEMRR